jgi:hypothetical protein
MPFAYSSHVASSNVGFTKAWLEFTGQFTRKLEFTNYIKLVNFLMREQA